MESALLSQEIGDKMTASGNALNMIAGLSGGPTAADNAKLAIKASKNLVQAFTKEASDRYEKLLVAYKLGKDTVGKDFVKPNNAVDAEHATHNMKANMGSVISAAMAIHAEVKLAYPVVDSVSFGDGPNNADAAAMLMQPLLDGEDLKE